MTAPFRYALKSHAGGVRPGHHRSTAAGSGIEFHATAPLSAMPDPRRLDLYASMRQPHGELMVRVLRERRAIAVYVLADLSASMSFSGTRRKMDVLAELTAATAMSAARLGDAFGFIGAAAQIEGSLHLPPTRVRGWGARLAAALRAHAATGDSAAGLLAAAAQLGRRPALVFLVSDFHFPLPLLDTLLQALVRHTVVPVMLWDRRESAPGPGWGIDAVRDLETRERRVLFMRAGLRARIDRRLQERHDAVLQRCLQHAIRPLVLWDGFDADQVSRYFLDPYAAPGNSD